jgi:hypothetical protein
VSLVNYFALLVSWFYLGYPAKRLSIVGVNRFQFCRALNLMFSPLSGLATTLANKAAGIFKTIKKALYCELTARLVRVL